MIFAESAAVGKLVAERAVKAGVTEVIFDRGGFLFHGRVKALADAARDSSDRGAIALLNEHGYRPLVKLQAK